MISDYKYSLICNTLFHGGFGRYDLPTASALELKTSLNRILKLDENLIVYPGHEDSTTIKDEKKCDYTLRFISNN